MANKLADLYKQLKSSVIGTKTQKTDDALDKAVKDIIAYKSHSGRNGYIDLVRTVIAKSTSGVGFGSGGLYSQAQAGPAAFGQGVRLMRYKTYEAIIANINYAYRALEVLVDNILSPDDITKVSLDIKPKSYLEDEVPTQSKIKRVKEVIKAIKLEEQLDMIVKNTLLLGDYFCEIAPPKVALTSKSIISESSSYRQYIDDQVKNGTRQVWTEKYGKKDQTLKVSIDYSAFMEAATSISDSNKKLINLTLVFHKPNLVIKLQSSLFPICFGYLVFPQITGMSIAGATLEDEAINNICMSILRNLENKIPQMQEFRDNKELQDLIKYMISQTNPNQVLEIRYVPPDKMTHFMRPSTKYYPYGESIYDATQYSAKVLIALETALAVQRLSRSTEKRKIAIEVGLPRDAKKAIEQMKEEFRKRKVSLDSFGTVDTIPSMITTFEDVYIPQKDGKAFVDVSTFNEGNVDVRSKTDELKFMRDQLTATWGVPPSFIGIEENLCVKSNTYIPLLNGYSLTLAEIISQYENGNNNIFIYSYDNEAGRMVPGKIKWAGYTRMQTKLLRVWLDNNKYIDCTPDHPFMLRDGTYKQAQFLSAGDSLMPLYTKNSITKTSKNLAYEMLYHPGINKWQLTYQAINEFYNKKRRGYVVHHMDYNPRNNHPDNLEYITNVDHVTIHGYDKVRSGTPSERRLHRECDILVDQKCKICKTTFQRGYNENTVTCSDKCRSEYHKTTGRKSYEARKKKNKNKLCPDLTCFICGKPTKYTTIEIGEKRYDKLKNKAIYCDSCKKRSRAVSNLTNKGTKLFCEIEYIPCEICGTTIVNSEDKKSMKTFCSIKCMNTVLGRRAAEKKRIPEIKLTCPICGEDFERPRWYVNSRKSKDTITCGSKTCVTEILSRVQTERYKDHHTKAKCSICENEFECTKIYKEQTIYPCCDNEECKEQIWRLRNQENKRVGLNHKVTKVEVLEGLHDTGDIEVEGYHNFAVDAGVIIHNSNKSALSEENILFARTVIRHQKYLSHQIENLVGKVFDIIDPEEALLLFEHLGIHLPTPKSLQYEREARYMNELVGLVESLERIGIPKEYSKKKYLSHFNWEEVQKYDIDEKVDKSLDPSKKEEEPGLGPGGGFGGASF